MSRWKIFGKTKQKEEPQPSHDGIPQEQPRITPPPSFEEVKEPVQETEQPKEQPITEHHETLYTKGDEPKQEKKAAQPRETPWRRTSWENPETIEKNIDTLEKNPKKDSQKSYDSLDIEEKVDRLIAKKKI